MLYMAVTPDRLELPLFVGTIKELSHLTGIRENTIYSNISKGNSGRYCGIKFLKVEGGV